MASYVTFVEGDLHVHRRLSTCHEQKRKTVCWTSVGSKGKGSVLRVFISFLVDLLEKPPVSDRSRSGLSGTVLNVAIGRGQQLAVKFAGVVSPTL